MINRKSFAIDLGNNNTLLTDDRHILLSQPSYIVFDKTDKSVRAVGDEAYEIFEKSHDQYKPVRPLKWGVIADYQSTTLMIDRLVRQVYQGHRWFSGFDRIVSGVPYNTTQVERMALRDVMEQFKSSKVNLMYEPLAAAIGMGLDIRQPQGNMVIDIGGGITEIVVISLSGVAEFQSLKVAGDSFTQTIIDYLRRERNVMVGWKTAEQIKFSIGGASVLSDGPAPMTITGKHLSDGIPVPVRLRHEEIVRVLESPILSIEEKVLQTLDNCPPELAADIYDKGIFLTGGSALLRGMAERLSKTTGLEVNLDPTPLLSVGKGLSKVLMNPRQYQAVLN